MGESQAGLLPGGAAMRVDFLWWFVGAREPATRQQRPEEDGAWKDDNAKPPGGLRRLRINPSRSHHHERKGEQESDAQIAARNDEQNLGDHAVGWVARPERSPRDSVRLKGNVSQWRIMLPLVAAAE